MIHFCPVVSSRLVLVENLPKSTEFIVLDEGINPERISWLGKRLCLICSTF